MAALRYLNKRDGFCHFTRRVPDRFAAFDRRGIVRTITGIRVADDPRGVRARAQALRLNNDLEGYWQSLIEGPAQEARRGHDAARERAKSPGARYVEADVLATDGPLSELVARLEALVRRNEIENSAAVEAMPGGTTEATEADCANLVRRDCAPEMQRPCRA